MIRLSTTSIVVAAVFVGGCAGQARERHVEPLPIRSLAVIPFDSEEESGLGAGVAREVAADLASRASIRIITPGRIPAGHDPRQVRGMLQADAVVSGRVYVRGDEVSAEVELTDGSGTRRSSERYEMPAENASAMPAEIGRRVGRLIGASDEPSTAPHESGSVWLLRMRAEGMMQARDERAAEELLRQALQRDESNALARSELARALLAQDEDRCAEAATHADAAIALDPSLPIAHGVLGVVRSRHAWDWTGAENAFRRAIELAPADPSIRTAYGIHLLASGHAPEALEQLTEASALDPTAPAVKVWMSKTLRRLGRPEAAETEIRLGVQTDPSCPDARFELALVLAAKGDRAAAVTESHRAVELGASTVKLAQMYALIGRDADAREVAERLPRLSGRERIPASDLAALYALLDERETSAQWMKKAIRSHDHQLPTLLGDPLFRQLAELHQPLLPQELARTAGNR